MHQPSYVLIHNKTVGLVLVYKDELMLFCRIHLNTVRWTCHRRSIFQQIVRRHGVSLNIETLVPKVILDAYKLSFSYCTHVDNILKIKQMKERCKQCFQLIPMRRVDASGCKKSVKDGLAFACKCLCLLIITFNGFVNVCK